LIAGFKSSDFLTGTVWVVEPNASPSSDSSSSVFGLSFYALLWNLSLSLAMSYLSTGFEL